MIVVAIIGLLAAIAIPQFSSYRIKAFDATAKTYIHFIATVEEGNFLSSGGYVAVAPGQGPGPTGLSPGSTVPSGVGYAVGAFPNPANVNYTAFAGHAQGAHVYATSQTSVKLRRDKAIGIDASTDAQGENTAVALPVNWGIPL